MVDVGDVCYVFGFCLDLYVFGEVGGGSFVG